MQKFEISAPWGEYKGDTWLAFIEQCRDHLKYYLEHDQTPNRQYTERDIEGYTRVIDSKSEKNAERFIALKNEDSLRQMKQFGDNIKVVNHLRNKGLWEG